MRLSLVTSAVLAVVLLSLPVGAQQANNNFGRVFCPGAVACPGAGATLPPEGLANKANQCVSQYFGYNYPTGYFDPANGLGR